MFSNLQTRMLSTLIVIVASFFLAAGDQDMLQECRTPLKTLPEECCMTENFFEEIIVNECNAKIRSIPMGLPITKKTTCDVNVCILSKHNLLTDNNKINMTAAKLFVEPHYIFPGVTAIYLALDTCAEGLSPNEECESDAYMKCLLRQVPQICPDSMWDLSDECAQTKLQLEKCT